MTSISGSKSAWDKHSLLNDSSKSSRIRTKEGDSKKTMKRNETMESELKSTVPHSTTSSKGEDHKIMKSPPGLPSFDSSITKNNEGDRKKIYTGSSTNTKDNTNTSTITPLTVDMIRLNDNLKEIIIEAPDPYILASLMGNKIQVRGWDKQTLHKTTGFEKLLQYIRTQDDFLVFDNRPGFAKIALSDTDLRTLKGRKGLPAALMAKLSVNVNSNAKASSSNTSTSSSNPTTTATGGTKNAWNKKLRTTVEEPTTRASSSTTSTSTAQDSAEEYTVVTSINDPIALSELRETMTRIIKEQGSVSGYVMASKAGELIHSEGWSKSRVVKVTGHQKFLDWVRKEECFNVFDTDRPGFAKIELCRPSKTVPVVDADGFVMVPAKGKRKGTNTRRKPVNISGGGPTPTKHTTTVYRCPACPKICKEKYILHQHMRDMAISDANHKQLVSQRTEVMRPAVVNDATIPDITYTQSASNRTSTTTEPSVPRDNSIYEGKNPLSNHPHNSVETWGASISIAPSSAMLNSQTINNNDDEIVNQPRGIDASSRSTNTSNRFSNIAPPPGIVPNSSAMKLSHNPVTEQSHPLGSDSRGVDMFDGVPDFLRDPRTAMDSNILGNDSIFGTPSHFNLFTSTASPSNRASNVDTNSRRHTTAAGISSFGAGISSIWDDDFISGSSAMNNNNSRIGAQPAALDPWASATTATSNNGSTATTSAAVDPLNHPPPSSSPFNESVPDYSRLLGGL